MKISEYVKCINFPCKDIDKNNYVLPYKDIDVKNVRIIMITEAPPDDKADYFYAEGNPFYLQTTLRAFRDAGVNVSSMQDILQPRSIYHHRYKMRQDTVCYLAGYYEKLLKSAGKGTGFIPEYQGVHAYGGCGDKDDERYLEKANWEESNTGWLHVQNQGSGILF